MNVLRSKLIVTQEDADIVISTCIVHAGIARTKVTHERSSVTVTCDVHGDSATSHDLCAGLSVLKRKLRPGSFVSWMRPGERCRVASVGGIDIVEQGFVVA